jgi:hypothetical protein
MPSKLVLLILIFGKIDLIPFLFSSLSQRISNILLHLILAASPSFESTKVLTQKSREITTLKWGYSPIVCFVLLI